jgi:D-alanyl-D-alanine carboxypeptidase/D-alanyl-D-alanine-endopeptidase (penicillin-binding protein 4)
MNRRLWSKQALMLVTLLFAAPGIAWCQQPQANYPPSLTQPTSIIRPVPPTAAEPRNGSGSLPDVAPARPDVVQPDLQALLSPSEGVLVETQDGRTVLSQSADITFNPASAVKLATALAALATYGPGYRFDTGVWTNGTFDAASGTIKGDLILSGRDPSFHFEHAIDVARELNKLGVRTVTGDLIVPPKFTMNFDASSQRSGDQFYDTLDATRRPAAATRAWNEEQALLRNGSAVTTSVPSVAVMGAVYVDAVPQRSKILLVHRSSRIVDILKVLLCYSNNFMAERVGDTVGGPEGVRRVAITNAGVSPSEISLSSTSGLGVNRVTPRAMLKVYRALAAVLEKSQLSMADILPVAGIDPGTLQKRYVDFKSRGSVIAKTGTLTHTDGGASALVGQMKAADGSTLLFAIFNRGGNIWRSRQSQDALVTQIQALRGGPSPFDYRPATLQLRLADTVMNSVQNRANEYEPTSN